MQMRPPAFTFRLASEADRAFVEDVYFGTQRWIIEELFGWRGDDVERAKFAEFYDESRTRIISFAPSGTCRARRSPRRDA